MKIWNLCLIILLTIFNLSCSSGSSSGTPSDNNNDNTGDVGDDTNGPTEPAISGFDYTLSKGDFWEYGWDYQSSYVSSYSSSSSSAQSNFRITLGDAITVDGVSFYEMLFSGNTQAAQYKDLQPHGKYVGISDNQLILLESDQTTRKILFDAQTGSWPGGGIFTSFPSGTLFEATLSSISNDYINQTAYQVSESSSSSQCEYFPGVGTICGGDYDENLIEREYYIAGLGPVGYYGHFSMSDWSSPDGGWSSSNSTNIGLTASSLRGDIVDYELEVEPNNQIGQATAITLPARIKGDNTTETYLGGTTAVTVGVISMSEVEANDSPFSPQVVDIPSSISANILSGDAATTVDVAATPGGTQYTASFEDWYELTLGSGGTLDVSLNFPNSGADLDMYLFSLEGTSTVVIHANSVQDNVATSDYSEHISQYLSAGTYYVAVDAYSTPAGRTDYTLALSTGDSAIDIGDWFSFSLAYQSQVTITVMGGPSFVLTDSSATTTLASGGASGTSITLDAGSYLIGVSDDAAYTLEVETP